MSSDVLMPTDGSQSANGALGHGIEIASQWDATLHVLYVVDTQAGLTVVTEVTEGTPHEAILDYASGHGVDMIVMGTHGRTGFDRAVAGRVAEGAVRQSPAPVPIFRSQEP
ncbi:Nucleotide-binding protein, UspA family [Halapricum desulfuricans]|uniref:Nucleotide-binding protein, UspA family n=1 Tax=Halapricum desulfuricans TaxID=2841257 RepID=A0A897NGG1_9EURY|nr:universal stress protein [Halapricum desulfuricans]QSG10535.1 Nucleotide-binding protein, UspA family [Halapricum desulfuricans]